jgi:hypothetical protein
MPETAFTNKTKSPTAPELKKVLGDSAVLWQKFADYITEHYSPIAEVWKFGKTGWMLVLKSKKRTVCYLFPAKDFFTVAFVLGEKAVNVARESTLPKKIMDAIEVAKPYVEGRGFYVVCKKPGDLKHLLSLTAIKMDTQ